MRVHAAVFVLFLFVIGGIGSILSTAAPATTLTLVVKDISNNSRIASLPVLVKLTDVRTGMEDKASEFIDHNGELVYTLEPGNWRVELAIFDPKTEGVTYYGQRLMYIQPQESVLNRSFYLTPIGTLEGVAVHEDGRLAGEAQLVFDCPYGNQFDYPEWTDQFGGFKLLRVPAGTCRITAATKDHIGTAEVVISKGEVQTTKIVLDQSPASLRLSNLVAWLVVAGVVLVVLLVGYALLRRKLSSDISKDIHENGRGRFARRILRKIKRVRSEPKAEPKPAEGGLNPRARDILQTLNEREKKTVEFLVGQKGHQATQAQLRNNTGIPKTSLVRVFQSLEAKKVIALEKIGKMKKVTLTPWFMGKE